MTALARRISSLKQRATARDEAIGRATGQHCLCDCVVSPRKKKNLDSFCPCAGNPPGKAIAVALPSTLPPTPPGHQDFGLPLDCLCVHWETEWLWHSFTKNKCGFPLKYTGRISEGVGAWLEHANPELELQSASSSPRCKEPFTYTLKHLPIHATMSAWKYRPGVGHICLTARANRAGLHHSGRQEQSMGLCGEHRNIKAPGFSPQIT